MMPYKVVSVRPLEHLRLAVRFADGLTGDMVLKESHLYSPGRPMRSWDSSPHRARPSIQRSGICSWGRAAQQRYLLNKESFG